MSEETRTPISSHLTWIVPAVIAFLGALWFMERSLIENGEVRINLLEHRVEVLEKEIDNLKQ